VTTREFSHEADAQRYTLRLDGQIAAVADYRVNGNAISFHHTFTQPNLRGRGLAGEVVEFAVNDVEKTSTRRVVPMCWYVADWFEQHPERAELLTR
jgi:predicted GNAT family acetyltransferase